MKPRAKSSSRNMAAKSPQEQRDRLKPQRLGSADEQVALMVEPEEERRKKSSLSDQVITSLQVNSKKALLPSKSRGPHWPQPSTSRAGGRPERVLDPSGALYHHWSMVVSLAFLYNFWSLSYRFAFREIDFETVAFWFALDYLADLIYALDVVINCRTGYLEDGVLQRKREKISQHYRECTLFYLDCFCLLPLDILYLSIGFNSILRCTRLVKIYKFWSYVDRTERHTNYPNVFRTFTLVHYILVIFHWNACLFHMISKNKIIDIEDLYKINDNRCYDILCQYLHAFYWSTLALTTIGDLPRPRTKGEYLYVIVELFFGLFLFASVLGHVANIVTNVSAARKEFQAKLDAVKTFMRMRRVSDELQNKVIRWFDYLWISQKSSDEERSVACLPDRLKAEIAIHVHLDTLKRVDIFQNTEAGFLCELVLRLKPVLFSPGDYVCRKNEVGHEMYIVSRGILEVVTEEGKTVVATLKAGSYFGEISVLNVGLAGNKRTASVRSVGYSDLFCLNKQDLWDVLKNYPNAEARIRARAEERLSKLDIPRPALEREGSARRRLYSAGSRHRLRAACCARQQPDCFHLPPARPASTRGGLLAAEEAGLAPDLKHSRSLEQRGCESEAIVANEIVTASVRDHHGTASSRDSSLERTAGGRASGAPASPTPGGRSQLQRQPLETSPGAADRCRPRADRGRSKEDSDEEEPQDREQRRRRHCHPLAASAAAKTVCPSRQPRLSSGSLNSSCLGSAHQPLDCPRRRYCVPSEPRPDEAACRHGRPRRSRRRRPLPPSNACHTHCDELSDVELAARSGQVAVSSLCQPAYWLQAGCREPRLGPIIQVPFVAAGPDAYQLLRPLQLASGPAQSVSLTQLSAAQSQVVSSQTQSPSPLESQWLLLSASDRPAPPSRSPQPLDRRSHAPDPTARAQGGPVVASEQVPLPRPPAEKARAQGDGLRDEAHRQLLQEEEEEAAEDSCRDVTSPATCPDS